MLKLRRRKKCQRYKQNRYQHHTYNTMHWIKGASTPFNTRSARMWPAFLYVLLLCGASQQVWGYYTVVSFPFGVSSNFPTTNDYLSSAMLWNSLIPCRRREHHRHRLLLSGCNLWWMPGGVVIRLNSLWAQKGTVCWILGSMKCCCRPSAGLKLEEKLTTTHTS